MRLKQKRYLVNQSKGFQVIGRRTRLLFFVLPVVIILGLGTYGVYKTTLNSSAKPADPPARPVNSVDYSAASSQDNTPNDKRKSDPDSAGQTLTTSKNSSSASAAQSPTVTITRAGVVNGSFQVGTIVGGVTSGTCVLNMRQPGQATVSQTNSVTLQNNTYVCPVFNIPVNQFSNSGPWTVSVTVTEGGKSVTGQWTDNPVRFTN